VVQRIIPPDVQNCLIHIWMLNLAQDIKNISVGIKHSKLFHPMQVNRILDRRSLYEGRYKYKDVEADGQHPAIIN
jgi:hypothetical protein